MRVAVAAGWPNDPVLEVAIRAAAAADAPLLALVGAATFLESYAHMIPAADILAHCARHHTADAYAALLADGGRAWLAYAPTGAPVGYAVLVAATLPPGAADPRDRELLRIYVLQRFQAGGVGRVLMAAATAAARAAGAPRLVLGTHQWNAKALAFYAREGFTTVGERRFRVGASCFCDLVLARAP